MRWAVAILVCVMIGLWIYPWGDDAPRRAVVARETAESIQPERVAPPAPSQPEPPAGPYGEVLTRSSEPVEGALVLIDASQSYETGADGRFAIGWSEDAETARFKITHHELLDLDEKRAKADGAWKFVLERGESVAGRVEFTDGQPAPGIGVNAATPGPGRPLESSWGSTDDDGRFELTGLQPGVVWVQCDGDPVKTRTGTRDLRFVIHESWLRLRIEDREGRMVAASYVKIECAEHPAYINDEGQAQPKEELILIPSGADLAIRVVAPGFKRAYRRVPSWSKTGGYHKETIVLERSSGASLLLDIHDAAGERPEHVRVKELGADGKAEFGHRFATLGEEPIEIGDLEPGPVVLRIYTRSEPLLWRDITVRAEVGATKTVKVNLPAGGQLSVQLPNPPRGANARIRPVGSKIMFNTTMDKRGLVTTFRMPVGKYEITAFRGEKMVRQEIVELQDTGVMRIDWSDLND